MKFNVMKNEEQHGIGTWIKMWNKWNDWCETLIFQSIAIETENGFRIKATYCPSLVKFLKGVKNYEVHHSKSIWWSKHI